MFLDPAEPHDWQGYAYTIVGAGPAGLYLAEQLAKRGRVLVIEAGGTADPLSPGKGYYELDVTGQSFPSLGSRLSAFGGTSNHWGGRTRPLSPVVFDNRPGIPGWPIAYNDFSAHLPEAERWLNLQPFLETKGTTGLERGIFAGQEELDVLQFHYSSPIIRLGDAQTRGRYATDPDIDVLVDTRVMDMAVTPGTTRLATLDLLHRPSGRKTTIPVSTLIVAAGAIENARLLLWAGHKYQRGNPFEGGRNRLTGKYFTDHFLFQPLEVFADDRIDLSDANYGRRLGGVTDLVWMPSEAFLMRHKLPRFIVLVQRAHPAAPDAEFKRMAPRYFGELSSIVRLEPWVQAEQTPHAGSYVGLSSQLDADGVPRPDVHWQVLQSDYDGLRRGTTLFCGLLNQNGFARARLRPQFRGEDWREVASGDYAHQIGTTRMGSSADDGVVDRNCKVFGLDNLYVAGSSVFPSGDFVNPTLNLVALAGRLARHLVEEWSKVLHFGSAGDGNAALASGWSYLEGNGVWSDGAQARITLAGVRASTLVLYGHAYRNVTGSISVNGRRIFAGQLGTTIGLPLSFDQSDAVEIVFDFTNPTAPVDVEPGNPDARKLGVFLEGLAVR